ncbi:hypothetical protein HDV01_003910 [Terramyces sp. JEL0728]|nr:hypothetical protein HDV01_003910 [Terramyces sp. JEL0728]
MLIHLLLAIAKCQPNDTPTFDDPLIKSTHELQAFSFQAPYVEDSLRNRWWKFGGDAFVNVNEYIRLTRDTQSQSGWLWSNTPMYYSSWIVEFEFKVQHEGALSGDGFAFWVTKEKEVQGPVFGSKDHFEGLGLFFDTYANSRVRHSYPYVMAMMGDEKTTYDHDFDGNSVEAGGCSHDFRNQDNPTKARLTYLDGNYLKLELTSVHDPKQWIQCFKIEQKIPLNYFFGFTAATGGVSSKHDLIYAKTYAVTLEVNSTNWQKAGEEQRQKSYVQRNDNKFDTSDQYNKPPITEKKGTSGVQMFIYFVLLAIVGYVGFVIYRTSQQKSNKRF